MSGLSKVLIGGGSGFVGRRLARQLKKEGMEPIMISRKPGQGQVTWNQLHQHGIPANCTAVVNLAGENIGNPLRRYNDQFKSDVYESRVGTTRQLAEAIIKSETPPDVFVTASAIGYYKPDEHARYTEDSAGGDFDFMSCMVRDWEEAGKHVSSQNVRHVIVRIGLVLGREGGLISSLWVPFFTGVGGRVGSGRHWMPWIHAEDIAGVFVHAIKNKHVTGVLNGVAPNCVRNDEFSRAFAKAMNRPALFPVPELALKLMYGEERAAMFTSGVHVLPKRTLESGYKFKYNNVEEACEDCASYSVEPDLRHRD